VNLFGHVAVTQAFLPALQRDHRLLDRLVAADLRPHDPANPRLVPSR
jgi:hypothetical protein